MDLPSLKEHGIDVELANWRGVVAAPGLDDAQKKALVDAVSAMAVSDGWKKALADKGWMDLFLAGEEFGKYLQEENARITATLKEIGLLQ
jgi:putative tricarboxylic transport membrane protein